MGARLYNWSYSSSFRTLRSGCDLWTCIHTASIQGCRVACLHLLLAEVTCCLLTRQQSFSNSSQFLTVYRIYVDIPHFCYFYNRIKISHHNRHNTRFEHCTCFQDFSNKVECKYILLRIYWTSRLHVTRQSLWARLSALKPNSIHAQTSGVMSFTYPLNDYNTLVNEYVDVTSLWRIKETILTRLYQNDLLSFLEQVLVRKGMTELLKHLHVWVINQIFKRHSQVYYFR